MSEWRWESYGGIEVQVPHEYGWRTTGSPLNSAWCADSSDKGPPAAGVNRGHGAVMPAIMCPSERPSATYAPSVDLGASLDSSPVDHGDGWISESTQVAGVSVTVSDNDATRRQLIVDSVRQVDGTDIHGCTPDSELRRPGARPSAGPLPAAEQVTGASICRYALPTGSSDLADLPEPVLSSSRLNESDARRLVSALHAAPAGSGPNTPANCAEDRQLGDEMAVVLLDTADSQTLVTIRYSGCDGHGTDDGEVVRELTEDVLNQVLSGPNTPSTLQGAVAELYSGWQ